MPLLQTVPLRKPLLSPKKKKKNPLLPTATPKLPFGSPQPPTLYLDTLNFFPFPPMNISFSCPWDFTQSVFALLEATLPGPQTHILRYYSSFIFRTNVISSGPDIAMPLAWAPATPSFLHNCYSTVMTSCLPPTAVLAPRTQTSVLSIAVSPENSSESLAQRMMKYTDE